MNCPKCNQPIEQGAVFCGNCGQALQAAPAPTPAAIPQPVVPQQPVQFQPTTITPTVAPTPVVGGVVGGQPAAPVAPVASPVAQAYANAQPVPGAYQPPAVPMVPAGVAAGLPSYAVAAPTQHAGETKALVSVILGVVGIISAILIPIVGVFLGIIGIVLGTMSHGSRKRALSTTGIVLSSLAIIIAIAVVAIVITRGGLTKKDKLANDPALNGTSSTAASAATPCYNVNFSSKLSIKNTSGSCDMSAFDGATLDESNDAYKVYAVKSTSLTADNFQPYAKDALEQDVKSNLVGFTVQSEQADTFAGSQAYSIVATDNVSDVAVIETAVLHPVTNGDNIFLLAHAIQGKSADLKSIESGWTWK